MANASPRWWLDLLVGIVYTVIAVGAVVTLGVDGLLRAVVVLPFLLFVPGYAALVVLYPERQASGVRERRPGHAMTAEYATAGIAPGERVLLSIVASAAITPGTAILVNFAPVGIRATTMAIAVGGLTTVLFVLGFLRRARVTPSDRGGVAPGSALHRVTAQFRIHSKTLLDDQSPRPTSIGEVVLNIVVAVAVLGLVAGAAFAYTAPTADQSFTEFYLVGQTESGNYTIDAVPATLPAGEQQPVYPTITNERASSQEYVLVVERQRIDRTDTGVSVTDEQHVTTITTTVDPGETVRTTHELGPLDAGTDYRFVYLLYTGEPPNDPSRSTADRSLRLYVTGTDGGNN